MDRPTGVTILAVLNFLGAALYILIGLGFILGMGILGGLMGQAGGEGAGIRAHRILQLAQLTLHERSAGVHLAVHVVVEPEGGDGGQEGRCQQDQRTLR